MSSKTTPANQVATVAETEGRKRVQSDASKAAALYTKIGQLDTDEKTELANSPADIARKYQQKREKLLDEASEPVVDLVIRMRGPAPEREPQ